MIDLTTAPPARAARPRTPREQGVARGLRLVERTVDTYMESPERPTEDQILEWLSRARVRPLRLPRGQSSPLPRVARILWLRYCAEPPLSARAIADASGLSAGHISALTRRGLILLAALEAEGDVGDGWDPAARLARAVAAWHLRRSPARPTAAPGGLLRASGWHDVCLADKDWRR